MKAPIIELVVDTPRGDANTYEWDARAKAIRLRAARHSAECQPFERGYIANSLTLYGEPLAVQLASSFPTFAGCHVTARVIGALEYRGEESIETRIVAVAVADAYYEKVITYLDLGAEERQFVEGELRTGAHWIGSGEAYEVARAAQRRGRLTRMEDTTNDVIPAWQMNEDDAVLLQDGQRSTHFSLAETRLYTLPLRFQNYVAVLLAPGERILMWVYRPLLKQPRFGGFGSEILRQGLLILTDQQFLWLRDPVTPSHTIAGYGYIARTFAIERCVDIEARLKTRALEFSVSLRNQRGDKESFAIEFSREAAAEVEQAARLLERFAPRANEKRLARRTVLNAFHGTLGDPTTSEQAKTQATLARLQAALQSELRDETIYAQAFVPEWGGAKLLTVTDRFVRLTADPLKRAASHALPLAEVGSVEICCSQLGSWLRVWMPKPTQLGHWEMAFPPVFSREFSKCAVALRAGCV